VLAALTDSFTSGGHGGTGFIATPDLMGAQPRDVVTLLATIGNTT
jgi:hypothetical protein